MRTKRLACNNCQDSVPLDESARRNDERVHAADNPGCAEARAGFRVEEMEGEVVHRDVQERQAVLVEREEEMVQARVRGILCAAAREPWDVHHQLLLDRETKSHEMGLVEIEQLHGDVASDVREGRYERAWIVAEAYRRIVAAAPEMLILLGGVVDKHHYEERRNHLLKSLGMDTEGKWAAAAVWGEQATSLHRTNPEESA